MIIYLKIYNTYILCNVCGFYENFVVIKLCGSKFEAS